MRMSKRILFSLVAASLSVCATFAQASPDKAGVVLPEMKPQIVLSESAVDLTIRGAGSGDQVSYKLVATHNVSVVSLDTERQMSLAIESAYLATDATLAEEESTLVARLTNEVGWLYSK